jgi:hypothetical protein
MQRRMFIATAGAVATVGAAGCLGGSGGDGDDLDTSSPEGVVESFYELSDEIPEDASGEEVIDTLDPTLHSGSPLRERFVDGESGSEDSAEYGLTNVDLVESEVTKENLRKETLKQDYLAVSDISEDVLDSIADENAIVKARMALEQRDEADFEYDWLTATEDGDWQILVVVSVSSV